MSEQVPDRERAARLGELVGRGEHWQAFAEPAAETADPIHEIGLRRILGASVICKMLEGDDVFAQVPRVLPSFRQNFASFNLDREEGYLISLAEGEIPLEKLLLVSTLGRYRTLLNLAALVAKGVLELAPARRAPRPR